MDESFKLLIVDDDDTRRDFIKRVAQAGGVQEVDISEAVDEPGANLIVQTGRPLHLAIVDVHLTPQEGKEGLRVIRKLRDAQHDCLIMCITRSIDPDLGAEAVNIAGADEFVDMSGRDVDPRKYFKTRFFLWSSVLKNRNFKPKP